MPTIGNSIPRAAAILQDGGVVAFPTETVYGLGGGIASPAAVARIYEMKHRPRAHPLIVHVDDFCRLDEWGWTIPAAARPLIDAFTPGALTLLLPYPDAAADAVCATPGLRAAAGGGSTIAVRAPVHPLAQELLRAFGGGVAAPSANRFGRLSPTRAAHVASEFADCEDLYILDGGACDIGLESTIVGFANDTGAPFVARPGAVTAADIARVCGTPPTPAPNDVRAPGTLPQHYAPQTPLRLVASTAFAQLPVGQNIGVIAQHRPPQTPPHLWRAAADDAAEYGKNLYRYLRELDAATPHEIWVEQPPMSEAWRAINDRLTRATTR